MNKCFFVATVLSFFMLIPSCKKEPVNIENGRLPIPPTHSEASRTTDTWSSYFENKDEKLAFLSEYLVMHSEVLDAEYHVVYHDNSGGLIPGPSDWDIKVALKVAPERIPLWTDGLNKLIRGQINAEMWDELKSDRFTWFEPEAYEYWRRPGSNTFFMVNSLAGIILIRASTSYIPQHTEIIHEYEVPGYDEYKPLAADALGYDSSVVPYIMTLQAETGSLSPGNKSTVILYRVFVYGIQLPGRPVMVVVTEAGTLCEVMIDSVNMYSVFYLADIDGDGYDEILAHNETGGNGGAGTWKAAVYKLVDGSLSTLFVYPGDYYNYDEGIKPGFAVTLADGWGYIVENESAGFSITFSRESIDKEIYEYPYFNEQGYITAFAEEHNKTKVLGVDTSFFIFRPVDVDDDGVFEIMTAQYTSLWGRANGIGAAYTIFTWDPDGRAMVVARAGFRPYEYDDKDPVSNRNRIHYYEDNWFFIYCYWHNCPFCHKIFQPVMRLVYENRTADR